MIFYLDTSSINSLLDSPNCALISERIPKRDIVYPSVFNIAEIGATSDERRRLELLKLTKQISGNYRPLAMPADLLKRALASVRARAKDMDHSMGPEWEGFRYWLCNGFLQFATCTDDRFERESHMCGCAGEDD